VTVALWIINIVLALVFVGAGAMKLMKSKEAYVAGGMAWAEERSPATLKALGAAEVLGAVGLIVPLATGIVPVLTPIAALCLCVVMIAATVTHLRRKEAFAPSLVLAVVCVVSAVIALTSVL